MSEVSELHGGMPISVPNVTASPSAGTRLRTVREAQGLHIAALAVALKVPVKKLEALESDRYDLLPDIVFVRAFASSVCRALKTDAEPILAALPQSEALQIKSNENGLNTPFKSTSTGSGRALMAQMSRPVAIVVSLLFVAIFAIVLVPGRNASDEASVVSEKTQVPSDNAVPAAPAVFAPAPELAVSATPLNLSESVTVSSPHESVPSAAASAAKGAVTTVTASVSDELPHAVPVLSLTARGPSWIDVTDANGVTQSRKTMEAGELLQVAGALPLAVVLGRADLVSVTVRGKPLVLTPLPKDNVARFEVK